jgi:hypothetical protein
MPPWGSPVVMLVKLFKCKSAYSPSLFIPDITNLALGSG